MIKTRQAVLAKGVYERLRARVREQDWARYSPLAVELGFLIRNNGLASALVFLAGKQDPCARALVTDLQKLDGAPWTELENIADVGQFASAISNLGELEYIRATQFGLAAAEWFNQFAESIKSPNDVANEVETPAECSAVNARAGRFRNWTSKDSCNPGQLLAFGYRDPSEQAEKILREVAEKIKVSDVYVGAYKRWFEYCRRSGFQLAKAMLAHRGFLGMGCADVFETHVQLHSVFGVPFISGETLKGLTSAYAARLLDERNLSEEQVKWLFGTRSESGTPGTAGNLQFHDAWWIPEDNSRPLTLEIDTPHHREYYQKEGGTPVTDYDDPNPVTHLAVKGSFLLAISGDVFAAGLTVKIAAKALATMGVGGRKSAGYGLASVVDAE